MRYSERKISKYPKEIPRSHPKIQRFRSGDSSNVLLQSLISFQEHNTCIGNGYKFEHTSFRPSSHEAAIEVPFDENLVRDVIIPPRQLLMLSLRHNSNLSRRLACFQIVSICVYCIWGIVTGEKIPIHGLFQIENHIVTQYIPSSEGFSWSVRLLCSSRIRNFAQHSIRETCHECAQDVRNSISEHPIDSIHSYC